MPTPAPAFPTVPVFPTPGDQINFNSQAETWALFMKNVYPAAAQAEADAAYSNAVESAGNASTALASATAAVASATSASNSANISAAAANFKGLYSSLSGALNKPASVKHSGRFWMLLNNLANVTTSVPSSSNTDWTSMDTGIIPTARISANTTAVPGVKYLFDSACTLTLPTTWSKGDYVGYAECSGSTACYVDWGTTPYRRRLPGLSRIDYAGGTFEGNYEDSTVGVQ